MAGGACRRTDANDAGFSGQASRDGLQGAAVWVVTLLVVGSVAVAPAVADGTSASVSADAGSQGTVPDRSGLGGETKAAASATGASATAQRADRKGADDGTDPSTGTDDGTNAANGTDEDEPRPVNNETLPLVRSWQKTPGGSNAHLALSIAARPDGGYLFAGPNGHTDPPKFFTGRARVGFVSPEGTVTDSDALADRAQARDVTALGDKSYGVAAFERYTVSQAGGVEYKYSGAVVGRYGPDGSRRWVARPHTKQINEVTGQVRSSSAFAVAPAHGGGVVVTGAMQKWERAGDRSPTVSGGAMLMKLGSDGTERWNRSLNTDPETSKWVGNDVVRTDSGYLIAGERFDFGTSGASAERSDTDGLIVGTNGKQVAWSLTLGGNGRDSFAEIVETADGYVVVGTRTDGGDADAWMVKVTEGGAVKWTRTVGGEGDQTATGVVRTARGNLTFAGGYSNETSGPRQEFRTDDPWLVHTTRTGEVIRQARLDRPGRAQANDIVLQGDYYALAGSAGPNGHETFLGQVIRCRDTTGDGSVDDDGDGLCDNWEAHGFDVDGDDEAELDLPAMGADPRQKDVFVEVDYMDCGVDGAESCATGHDHEPAGEALDRVESAFADAPVENPSGTRGVDIHFRVDEAVPENSWIDLAEYMAIKRGGDECGTGPEDSHFGRREDRADDACERILKARELTFHYLLSGHNTTEGALGWAAPFGNDVAVFSTGPVADELATERARFSASQPTVPTATVHEERLWLESVTVMHELGHNLGLLHGGGDNVNNKPNYLSVMNYQYAHDRVGRATSIPGVPEDALVPIGADLDYSRERLPALDETNLDEETGLQGPADERSAFVANESDDESVAYRVVPASGGVDWNDDGRVGGAVARDLNDDGKRTTLAGYNDWPNLKYNFRESDWYRKRTGALADVGNGWTVADHLNAGLGGPDADDDGVENVDDNCPLTANADQADGNDDGRGDACTHDTEPPVAGFTYDVGANGTVTFDAVAADPEHRGVVAYEWTFGDGATGAGANATHTFDGSGNYDVTLIVEDYDGDAATVAETITVEEGEDGSVGETDPESVTGTPTPTASESTATPDTETPDDGMTATPDGGTGATDTPDGGETTPGTATAAPGRGTTTAPGGTADGSETGDGTPTDPTGLFDGDGATEDDEGSGGSGPGFGAPVALAALLALLALARLRGRDR